MFSSLTEDQMQRIEAYRRLKLPEKVITAAMNGSIPGRISKNIELVVAGAAKVYAADVITYAQQVKADWGEEGPLRPEHLREGLRRYRLDQKDALPQYASKPNPYLNL
ncbi:histone-fold-containing protein [Hyaloraphidium curvatum]|nr:histone-fold-containing protein [Hyaloraphidium curvatum]